MSRIDQLPVWKKTLLLFSVVVVLTLILALVAEAAVRVRHYLKFGDLWGVESTFTVDPDTGLRIPVPNGEFGPVRINSRGFRSPEIAVPKPAGTVRIAFIGASTTYSAEVSSNDSTWPHLVYEALQRRWPDVPIDYVNAGVPGYGTQTSLQNLERRVRALEPDIIVIYHATNDLSRNSYQLAVRAGLARERTEQGLSWPSRHSLLWYLVEKNLKVRTQQRAAGRSEGKLAADLAELAAPFRTDLSKLVQASRESAVAVALITFATQLRAGQDPQQQAQAAITSLYYMPYMSIQGLLEGFRAYNRVIREVAAEQGVLLIENETAVPGDSVHFRDSVHLSDAGSRVMADNVVRALLASPAIRAVMTRR